MLPPLNAAAVKKVTDLAAQIVYFMDTRQDYGPLIADFNRICGNEYGILDFDGAAGSMSMEDFARRALTPYPPKMDDITDDEYLEIIGRFQTAQVAEPEIYYWLRLLDINIPCSGISDLIYGADGEDTAEQVLIKARQWRPIVL